ncbi:MAG: hypothetical protein ACREYF_18240 [Gammaproteobacteria bacterium]
MAETGGVGDGNELTLRIVGLYLVVLGVAPAGGLLLLIKKTG